MSCLGSTSALAKSRRFAAPAFFSVGVVVVVRPERFVIRRDVRTAADLPRRADHPLEVHVVLDERAEVMVILAEVVERDLAVLFEDLRNTK